MRIKLECTISDSVKNSFDQKSLPTKQQINAWAESSCDSNNDAMVSIQVVSRQEMSELNHQYRSKNEPTNVLSFPASIHKDIDVNVLGDIALCASVISAEASAQKKSTEAHWAHMVIHGMLHLQGYDHKDNHDAKDMEKVEIDILQKLGYKNPYIEML